MAGPGTDVDAPPLLPPTSGLLQVAEVIDHDDDRWTDGIRWVPPSDAAVELATTCWGGAGFSTARSTSAPVNAATPFAVIAHDSCLAVSFRNSEDEFRARSAASLKAQEPAAVEAEFERGALIPTNPRLAEASAAHLYLGSPANTQAGQLALTPKDALAALDEGIAYWGKGLGMIHAPAYVIAQWVAARAINVAEFQANDLPLDPKPRLLFSPNGNPIVAGSGYRGASPDLVTVPTLLTGGHAAMWAYATDLVTVHRDREVKFLADEMSQSLNRQNNEVTWRAYRMYAIAWSRLLHASVKIATPLVAAP